MPRIRPLAVAALLAIACVVGASAPAYAASPGADPTLTITPSNPLTEVPYITFTGGCPTGSDAVKIVAPGGGIISPVLDGAFDFSTPGIGYFARNFGAPGTALTFTVTCSTAGIDSPPTSSIFTAPLYGSSVTVPATVQTNVPVSISGTCGTAPGVSAVTVMYYGPGGALSTDYRALPGGGAFSFSDLSTPTAVGYAVGDSGSLNVFCETIVGPDILSYTVASSSAFTITAIPAPIDHAVLTALVTVPTNENSPVDFAGECGPTADSAQLHWNGPSDSGFYIEGLDADQKFTDTVDADEFGAPGEIVPFTLECYSGTTLLGSTAASITVPDSGSAVSMAATFTPGNPLVLSGTCGTTGATVVFVLWGEQGGSPLHSTSFPITGPTWSLTVAPTAADLGLGVGAHGFAQAYCISSASSEEDPLSGRNVNFAIVDVVATKLAKTGSDAAAPALAGILLLVAGAAVLRRRRASRA